jgi:ABC-2 type transport system ATP-binding protein
VYKQKLLKENIEIETLSMYEPDLTDIFVKKVGKDSANNYFY